MTDKKVTILNSSDGDWEALYIDGLKVVEGHSLSTFGILKALGVNAEYREVPADPDEFPDTL